jgi:ADP-ribose pyrophosphatase YjhB (NUDIX family)
MTATAPRPEVAVGAVVVRDRRLLLVKRGRGVSVGLWSLPGGRVDPAEPLRAAVRRELEEEVGLQVRVGPLCGIAERISDEAHYVIVDFWADADDGTPVAGDDAAQVMWADRADLDRLALVDGLLGFLRDHHVLDRL